MALLVLLLFGYEQHKMLAFFFGFCFCSSPVLAEHCDGGKVPSVLGVLFRQGFSWIDLLAL